MHTGSYRYAPCGGILVFERSSPRPRPTVLLVEGLQAYVDLEKTFLRREDVRVLTAKQDAGVLDLARLERPDVVVVDVGPSEPGGVALCRSFKADARLARIPVVLVLTRPLADEGREAGADAIAIKPIVKREFLETIRRFLLLSERRAVRQPVNLRFTFEFGSQVGQVFSRDLSPRGAFLKSDRPVPTGSEISLRFRLPGDPQDIACRAVVRSDLPQTGPGHAPGFGVEFEDLADQDRERLERFMERQARRSLTFL